MALLRIFKDEEQIDSLEYRVQCLIWAKDDQAYWAADAGLYEPSAEGTKHVWLQRKQEGYYIVFVRPDWRLIVDGVTYPQAFYENMPLDGHVVELQYRHYRFRCVLILTVLTMKQQLIAHLKRGGLQLFKPNEKSEAIVFIYSFIYRSVLDGCDSFALAEEYFSSRKFGQQVHFLPNHIKPTIGYLGYWKMIIERDELLRHHLALISETPDYVAYQIILQNEQ
jgi:hypothetical protein